MSSNGYQVGGCVGFLKTLQKLVRELSPTAICVAWEGGGSQRRRKLFPEYKLNKRPEKLNRFYGDDILTSMQSTPAYANASPHMERSPTIKQV